MKEALSVDNDISGLATLAFVFPYTALTSAITFMLLTLSHPGLFSPKYKSFFFLENL